MNSSARASERSLVTDQRNSTRHYGIHLSKRLISLRIWQDIPWTKGFNKYAPANTPPGNVSIAFETDMEKSIGSSKPQWNYAMRMEFHMVQLVHIRILLSASRLKNLFEQNARKHKSIWILPE